MKKELTIALLAVGMTIGMVTMTSAQEQDTDVDVNVSETTQLDVRPSALNYGFADSTSLEPGDSATESDDGFEHVEIANIGSERIGEISAEADMPSQNPFGTGNSSDSHITGNLVTISTATADSDAYDFGSELYSINNPHYLNRVEYAEEPEPTYIDASENAEVGRFRVGEAEYFFAWDPDDSEQDPSSDTDTEWDLRIGQTPHTSSELGTTDFTDSSDDVVTYTNTDAENPGGDTTAASYIESHQFVAFNDDNYPEGGIQLIDDTGNAQNLDQLQDNDGEVRSYNLYLNFVEQTAEPGSIVRTTANTNIEDPTSDGDRYGEVTSGSQQPILASTTASNQLQPGQSFPVDIGIELPLGLDQDSLAEGTVTFIADQEGGDEPE